MTSPFDKHRDSAPNDGGKMKPGDVRTVHGKDKDGNIVKTIHIHRTTREYCYDLCDAYNAARPHDRFEYYVHNGEVKLGEPSTHRRPQPDYKPTDEDLAQIKEYVAGAMADGVTQEQFNAHVRKTGGCPLPKRNAA